MKMDCSWKSEAPLRLSSCAWFQVAGRCHWVKLTSVWKMGRRALFRQLKLVGKVLLVWPTSLVRNFRQVRWKTSSRSNCRCTDVLLRFFRVWLLKPFKSLNRLDLFSVRQEMDWFYREVRRSITPLPLTSIYLSPLCGSLIIYTLDD